MNKRSRFVVPLFTFLGVLLLTIGAGGAAAHTQLSGGASAKSKDIASLTWAVPATIRGLDYTHSADAVSASVISLGMETLVQYDRLGGLSRTSRWRSRRRTRRRTATSFARA